MNPKWSAGVLLFVSGCYTTTNVVTVMPLQTAYPVSASKQYVEKSGSVVTEHDYQVLAPFTFNRTFAGPRHDSTEALLRLEPDLDRLVTQARGDAVTNLKIEGTNYDSGSHDASSQLKALGWVLGVVGAAILVGGAASEGPDRSAIMAGGGITAGVGVLSYIVGIAANDPSIWQLQVSGNVVRHTAAAAQ